MPTDQDRSPWPQRLQGLEESLAFAEHALEQLSAQMATLLKRQEETERRLRRLESPPARPQDQIEGETAGT